jgi:8-oxo-dGTP pyrophosphatase MutT (NUDIX family)
MAEAGAVGDHRASEWYPASVRERLARALDPAFRDGWLLGDEGRDLAHGDRPRTPAGVLIALVPRPAGPSILLTRRTAHLRDHAGQISLPGGRVEADETPLDAALREAEEEIGLPPARVEILGSLRPYDTGTGYRIHPVVGWVAEPPERFALDPFEVDELFDVPLAYILDEANHRRDSYERDGRRRHFYVVPHEGRHIWGATAGILVNLARVLRG